jgi:transposase
VIKKESKKKIPKEETQEEEKKEKKPDPTGILKVRLYPTHQQKKKLDKMFEANRYAWNILAEKIGGELFSSNPTQLDEKFRKYVKKSGEFGINPNLSIYQCNETCFDSAYRDVIKARKTTIELSKSQKKRTGHGFVFPDRLKFKSKKNKSGNSIEIRARDLKYNPKNRTISFFKSYFGDHHIRMKTDLMKLNFTNFQYSCRLNMVNDHYYLNVPYLRNVSPTNSGKVCAIDPGVKTFLTGYDPSGYTFEICSDKKHIRKKKHRIEELQRWLEAAPNKKKRDRIKQEIKNIYKKITNCVNDLHHKASRILADTYDEILLPSFNTQNMVKKDEKKKRKISPDTAYNMLTLSHYKFQRLLDHKMKIRQGKLHICTEEYTTMTCGQCGRLNRNVGSNSTYKCPYEGCGYVAGRDTNAARNIFIMNHKLVSTKYIE